MTTSHLLPHRFRPASALRFLSVVQHVHDTNPPCLYRFNPRVLALTAETAACRLRDAITSFQKGHTSHPTVNPTTLANRWLLYYVTHDGDMVSVVPKGEKQVEPPFLSRVVGQDVPVAGAATGISSVLHIDAGTPRAKEVLRALALLLSLRVLTGAVHVPSSIFPPELQVELTTTNDIALRSEGEEIVMI